MEAMSLAMRLRRSGYFRKLGGRSWQTLVAALSNPDKHIFNVSSAVIMGKGSRCSFWFDKWQIVKILRILALKFIT
jgi:hypothetical protein